MYWQDGIPFQYKPRADGNTFRYWLDGVPFSTPPLLSGDLSYYYPIADLTTGGWTQVPLYPKVSEVIANDTNYITSSSLPLNDICEMRLGYFINRPSSLTGHALRYRYEKSGIFQMDLTVSLYQGASLIKETTHTNIQNGWVEGSISLTTGEANLITNYNELLVRLTANSP